MKTAGNIASLLGIEAGEHRMVASMMGHFFLIGISRVYVMAPAYGLFLEEFSASTLPYVYLLVSILATLTAIGYLRLADRIPFRGLLVVNLAFIAATTILLRVGLDFPSREWVIFALPIWFEILWILTNLEFWSLAGRLFDVRQGKRLFGLLMAGRMSSEIVCGFLTPLVVLLIGTANLLLISAAATCLTIFALFRVTRTFRHRFEAAEETTGQSRGQRKHSFIGLLKGRYVQLLFGQALLGCVAYYFVDTIFYDRSAAQFPDTDRS